MHQGSVPARPPGAQRIKAGPTEGRPRAARLCPVLGVSAAGPPPRAPRPGPAPEQRDELGGAERYA
eukprot:6134838-Pyramimonas_sp.AAC.1